MVGVLEKLLASGMYKPVLHSPKHATVYRGIDVSEAWLRNALGIKPDKKLSSSGKAEAKMQYKPRNGESSSWTIKKQVASNFSNGGKRQYGIIMHAKISDNKNRFLSPAGIYKLDFASHYTSEAEAIGLGTINVSKLEWKLNQYHDDDSK